MKLYGAIDLHSNNNVTVLTDETDKVVYQKRLTNDLPLILEQLSPYAPSIEGIVVESTYNWYWLVDGLIEKGHRVHLANTAAIQQYEGLKYTDDDSDARWLAHLFRLGVLPEGYTYPKEERAVRDLLRKRSQLVSSSEDRQSLEHRKSLFPKHGRIDQRQWYQAANERRGGHSVYEWRSRSGGKSQSDGHANSGKRDRSFGASR
jgi:transposase